MTRFNILCFSCSFSLPPFSVSVLLLLSRLLLGACFTTRICLSSGRSRNKQTTRRLASRSSLKSTSSSSSSSPHLAYCASSPWPRTHIPLQRRRRGNVSASDCVRVFMLYLMSLSLPSSSSSSSCLLPKSNCSSMTRLFIIDDDADKDDLLSIVDSTTRICFSLALALLLCRYAGRLIN